MGHSTKGTFGPETIKGTGIALIVLTSLVVGTRFVGSIRSFKDIKAEDYLLVVGYLFFLTLSILYIYIAPAIFRLAAVRDGTLALYPTYKEDARQLQIVFFVTTSSLWLCLWMIKFSLLAMYKRLLVGKKYRIAWWVILGGCVVVRMALANSVHISLVNRYTSSLSSAAFSPRGSHARASMPGLQPGHAPSRETNGLLSSAYILHMRPISSLI